MAYFRPQAKAVVSEAAQAAGQSISSFVALASVQEVAATRGCQPSDLIPASELRFLTRKGRARPRKSATSAKQSAKPEVMVYLKPKTKGLLVEAAWNAGLPISSFLILASLEKIAAAKKCDISDLIPKSELQHYLRRRLTQKA
jgi:uncharacterized protein (DUF1778 family)